jgi:ABC-type phosphate transport system substrate-binding protein
MKSGFKLSGNIVLRIIAVFAASGLGVIGAGSIAGISVLKAVTVAGLTAVAAVVEKLARGFMNDGKLDMEEINAAFAAVDVNSKTAADLQVEAKQSGQDIVISAQGGTTVVPAAAPAAPEAPAAAAAPAAPEEDPHYN